MLTVAPREEDADGFVAVHRWTYADVEGWVRAIGLAACAAPLRLVDIVNGASTEAFHGWVNPDPARSRAQVIKNARAQLRVRHP